MIKLGSTIMISIVIAFFSTFFLYMSYAQGVLAQESIMKAASVEYLEKIIEHVVVDNTKIVDMKDSTESENFEEIQEISQITKKDIGVIEIGLITKKESPSSTQEKNDILEVEFTSEIDAAKIPINTSFLKIIKEIHERSNDARMKRGYPKLVFDEKLSVLALERSEDMVNQNYFSHTGPNGCGLTCNFEVSGYKTLVWGENIAMYNPYNESTMDAVAEIFVEKWLKSSGHRDNLLSEQFTHQGIGASVFDEKIIVTVLFANPDK